MASYRNGFEKRVAAHIGPDYQYEPIRLPYVLECSYLPDFVDMENKRIIEAKGIFDAADRRKLLAVKAQYPDWDIHILFQNPNLKITKGSKTTYGAWADKNGFTWSHIK